VSAKSPGRERLDVLMVERGLTESRERAQRLILANKVSVSGVQNLKPGLRISRECDIVIEEPEKYVSRGGYKLEAALREFAVDVQDAVCADVGASTGGFTDCLLQAGAARVYCIDVAASQLHHKLRADERVVLVEQTNARSMTPQTLPELAAVAVMDLSFISLTKVLDGVRQVLRPEGNVIALIKPQFEATRQEVSRGKGVIKSEEVHVRIIESVLEYCRSSGWMPLALIPSPITGGSGNREYLVHLRVAEALAVAEGIDVDGVVARAFNRDTSR
jgi:23S rRNA (cytidine1920-2'-O)/16S rRNA (cytidine1409-2'-O)-methyltransferase